MRTINDVHLQFARFFNNDEIQPYAYLLSKRLSEGHICIDTKINPSELEATPFEKVTPISDVANFTEYISKDPKQVRPFILHNDRLYFHRYFNYETQILDSIKRLLENEKPFIENRLNDLQNMQPLIKSLRSALPFDPTVSIDIQTDWQLAAAISAYCHQFTIITGGPGTGKTTTVAKVLSLLYENDNNLKVALAAPTGKAAVRVGESLKNTDLKISDFIRSQFESLKPVTIHSLLGYIHEEIYFKHNTENPLPYDVVIIDESSMIDVSLFAKLLNAIGNNTRLILLGDKNQLSSVEAGSLFGDLCNLQHPMTQFDEIFAQKINGFMEENHAKINDSHFGIGTNPLNNHLVELKRSHRFTEKSAIGNLSRAIIENNQEQIKYFIEENTDNSVKIDTHSREEDFEELILSYAEYISEPDISKELKKLNNFRVLCAVREGESGLYFINKKIEQFLRKKKILNHDGTVFSPDGDFYENRPVIVTKNYKDIELSNGDVGIIRKDKDGIVKLWFENNNNKLKSVLPAYINHTETVFAMTIHKSQGSEYNHILLILPTNKDNKLLTRELLYTGVTRAKLSVLIRADREIILKTAEATVSRASGIVSRTNELV